MTEGIIIALIGLFSGGLAAGVLKILEKILNRSRERLEQDGGIRSELRLDLDRKYEENARLRSELEEMEDDSDFWRAKYWTLKGKFHNLRLAYHLLLHKHPHLKEDIDSMNMIVDTEVE